MRKKFKDYPPLVTLAALGITITAGAITSIHAQTAMYAQELRTRETITSVAPEAERETKEIQQEALEPNTLELTTEEQTELLKIAMAEAEGESTTGKALVMRVVLNRVQDDEFPDTVREVIFQEGQFAPVTVGGRYYTTEPNEDCYRALDMIISGWDESEGALYFESCAGASWHRDSLEFLYQAGNHRFYR